MERLSIGDLARATGLTVRALRHYQDLGLLAPAGVDPATRYRSYGPEQLERAMAIARLGLPLARIRDYLAATPATRRRLLEDHRAELDARLRSTAQLQLELERLIGPGHERRNLGFDEAGPDGVLPAGWDGGGDRYDRGRDSSVAHSPGASGRIAFRGAGQPGEDDWATFAQTATTVPFRGGRVRYRGWLRTRDVASGWAGLWLRVDGPDREVLEFDNLGQVPPDRSLKGTNDWTQAEIVTGAGDAVADLDRLRAEGIPDATRLSPAEQATAARLKAHPDFADRTFSESEHKGAEYVDDLGRSYDAVGDPQASRYWNEGLFLRSIDQHLLKSNHFTVVDMTGFTPEQIAAVRRHLDGLTAKEQAKIIRIGF
jgi:DNA-binding transcriptional MerR regulator